MKRILSAVHFGAALWFTILTASEIAGVHSISILGMGLITGANLTLAILYREAK